MKYDDAIKIILEIEGGLNEDPTDPGGITKYGISLKQYPDLGEEGIRKLTKKAASKIYKRDYWDENSITSFPLNTRLAIFDSTVNHGAWVRLIQITINDTYLDRIAADGILGPITIGSVKALEPDYFLEKFLYQRQLYYRSLSIYSRWGETWERRLFKIALNSRV